MLSTGSIVGIVFAVMGFITSVSLHIFFHLRREKKREKKEREEREKADLEKGKADSSSTPLIEEQGLAPKPELEGTMVGAVMPKMELDSLPVAELPNTSHVGELDGSPSASTSQLGQDSANTARSTDRILPSPKQHGVTYELPG